MPIETTPSNMDQRIVRLGLGVSFAFVAGVGLGWPISFLGAIFTNLLLQAAGPVPLRGIGMLLVRASLAMVVVWYSAQFFLAYPAFFLVALTAAIFAVFRYAALGGADAFGCTADDRGIAYPVPAYDVTSACRDRRFLAGRQHCNRNIRLTAVLFPFSA
jgi:DUF2955 family protein